MCSIPITFVDDVHSQFANLAILFLCNFNVFPWIVYVCVFSRSFHILLQTSSHVLFVKPLQCYSCVYIFMLKYNHFKTLTISPSSVSSSFPLQHYNTMNEQRMNGLLPDPLQIFPRGMKCVCVCSVSVGSSFFYMLAPRGVKISFSKRQFSAHQGYRLM